MEQDLAPDQPGGGDSPHLNESEREQAASHASPKALVIHEVVREEGEAEIKRKPGALAWSGLAAGLSMGFSFFTMGLVQSLLPETSWRLLISSSGYSVGFVIAILGKQQLFTESTLTAVLPLLVRRNMQTFMALLRMWGIVLSSNLVGTIIFAWFISRQGLFPEPLTTALADMGTKIVSEPAVSTIMKAVLAGWLIALMVWLLPGARTARIFVIMMLTYVVALAQFPHVIAGSAEAAYAVFSGRADIGAYLGGFLLPTLVGNTLGGVALAAILNHAPLADELSGEQI